MYFVKHYHTIPPTYGGVSVFVKRLMLALCKKNLTSGAFKGTNFEGIPSGLNLLLDSFPKHARSLFILPEFPKLYRSFLNYRLIHTHTSFSTVFGIWLVHKIQKKPVVYTVHNQMIDREFSFLNFIDKFCIRSLAKDSTVQFITVNENVKEAILKRVQNFANDIEVMPAYIPPVEIGNPTDYISKELLDFSMIDAPTILFYAESFAVSSNKDIYGTSTIIEAFICAKKRYPNIRLIFCLTNINSDQNKLDNLKQRIISENYEEDVYWQIGAIPEMWPLFKMSVVLVRPTTTDGDSVMVREALSYGLPVIASNVAKRPEGCIVYESEEFEDLCEKLNSYLSSPYRKEYMQKDYTEDMIKIYNRLLS